VRLAIAQPAVIGGARREGLLAAVIASAGVFIASYLAIVKLAGGVPACGPLGGCDTVNTSLYAEFMGIPIALFGAGASGLVVAGAAAWWRRATRAGLIVAYVVGLASLPVLAYLTYLELFVISAICIWCVAYALTVIGAWLVTVVALRSTSG
jgi:uncharacterized membrane protein